MATIDLKDAYLHIPILTEHQAFLRFAIRTDQGTQHWQFQALPFGLGASPRVFTKSLAEVVLHLQGISLIPYLDYLLVYNLSRESLLLDLDKVISTLESLGWLISHEKSSLTPSQIKLYLGLWVDSVGQKLILPQERIEALISSVSSILGQGVVPQRVIMRILGLMTSCIPAVS